MSTEPRTDDDFEGMLAGMCVLPISHEGHCRPSPDPAAPSLLQERDQLAAALDRLYEAATVEEEDVSPATHDELVAALNQAGVALVATPTANQPSTEPPPCDDPAGHLAALCNCYLEAEGAWHEFVNLVYRLIPDGDIRGPIIGAAARLSSQPSTEPDTHNDPGNYVANEDGTGTWSPTEPAQGGER